MRALVRAGVQVWMHVEKTNQRKKARENTIDQYVGDDDSGDASLPR